ncbi:MAG: hypothetical protein FWG55_03170 [Candidatus Bathyarchaeota archaeon]|nr:hypothetical protein [Candidatus Termiticorpusculum sp.]
MSSSVTRNFATVDEERALTAAETVDYAAILTFKRFEGPSDSEAYIHHGSSLSYTWANFIDSEVLDYYQNRFDYQQKQIIRPRGVTFTYNANVTYFEQLHIFNTTRPEQGTVFINDGITQKETITWNSRAIIFYGPDESIPLTTVYPFEYMLCRNQSGYYALPSKFDLTFSNCYFIEMNLQYSEVYAPLAAFWSDVHQIVVLDQNLVPIWLGITVGQAIS